MKYLNKTVNIGMMTTIIFLLASFDICHSCNSLSCSNIFDAQEKELIIDHLALNTGDGG